jgi:hypothetical protein
MRGDPRHPPVQFRIRTTTKDGKYPNKVPHRDPGPGLCSQYIQSVARSAFVSILKESSRRRKERLKYPVLSALKILQGAGGLKDSTVDIQENTFSGATTQSHKRQ